MFHFEPDFVSKSRETRVPSLTTEMRRFRGETRFRLTASHPAAIAESRIPTGLSGYPSHRLTASHCRLMRRSPRVSSRVQPYKGARRETGRLLGSETVTREEAVSRG